MMEKELNKQLMYELIRNWTEERLTPETDSRITESLLDFVENDDTEIDVNVLLDLHIHELAEEELTTRRRKWKFIVAPVAAASVVLFVVASAFMFTRENNYDTDTEIIAVEKSAEENHTVIGIVLPTTMAETSGGIDHSSRVQEFRHAKKRVCPGDSTITKTRKNGNATIHREERAQKQQEETPELILTETLAEINAGLVSMADNTRECLSMTNASMIPVTLMPEGNETNIIETNLINALYEIRNLNIELNFNTDNKTTEI